MTNLSDIVGPFIVSALVLWALAMVLFAAARTYGGR